MSKRLTAFVPAALIGGVLLLSACGQAGNGLAAKDGQSTPTNSTSAPSTSADVVPASNGEGQPVECGPVKIFETTHILVTDTTGVGNPGCTEAFNVLDEYLNAPRAGDVFNTKELPGGWTCSQDDGEFAAIDCKDEQGFTFHTEDGGPSEGDSGESDPGQDDSQPGECGPVEVNTVQHMLVTDTTAAGNPGCTEAFNVLDEYLNAPRAGDVFNTQTLPSGWTCSQDDGEFAAIDCKNEQGFTFHTEEPVK
jgi:hypothetical protein